MRIEENAYYFNKLRQNVGLEQWRTQKIFMAAVSFSGVWWSFVFGVRCL